LSSTHTDAKPPIVTRSIDAPDELGTTVHVYRFELRRLEELVDMRPNREARDMATVAFTALGVAITAAFFLLAFYGADTSPNQPGQGTSQPPVQLTDAEKAGLEPWVATAAWWILGASLGAMIVAAVAAKRFQSRQRDANAMLKQSIGRLDYARSPPEGKPI
jgi:hypothetical protein